MTSFPKVHPVEAVVFDCDGLLADTEQHWHDAESEMYLRRGLTAPPIHATLGSSVAGACVRMAREFGARTPADIHREFLEIVVANIAGSAEPRPGAASFVRACAATLPIYVASNSPRLTLDVTLTQAGFADLVPLSVSADDVTNPKPAADLYVKACRRLGVSPRNAVAFEDSRPGVAAARAAGMYVFGVPSVAGSVLPADSIIDSLEDPQLTAWLERVAKAKTSM